MRYNPFRNLGLKAVAVALASVLWLTLAGEHVVERSLRAPLEFRNIPDALEIVGNAPDSVDVRLRGSSAALSRVQPGEIVAVLDLAGARAGSRLFHIRADEVRVPFGIEVSQVVPATLALELEKSARRTVPVVPAVEGEPAPGFVVGRVTADPPSVEIVGPESRVRQVAEATTEPVSVKDARSRVRDGVTIGVVDASVRLVQAQSAQVAVEIWPAPVERQVTDVPVRYRNLGAGLRGNLSPQLVRVTVRGARDALAAVRADSVDAFVDLAGLGSGRYNLRVQVEPSENFGVVQIEPAVVSVVIR
ncbi:MAG TPA: CdaR family protein [Vicinamibacterales bacterium]|nr:CdaR family protein [Vicinamibacterales bacterium]